MLNLLKWKLIFIMYYAYKKKRSKIVSVLSMLKFKLVGGNLE